METKLLQNSLDGDVYVSFWIDRLHGTIRGATLALDRSSGGLLIVFLALYVSASRRGFWKLVRRLLHLVYLTHSNTDGVRHQRQSVLRNTPLALDTALISLGIAIAWRRNTARFDTRLLVVGAIALISAVTFLAAGQ